ncbi:MAG: TIR domain-containing protein [Gammaproteobacteria bacterium]|nr:TIR domain-containing protein [Gammaproteobacteria bacterium]
MEKPFSAYQGDDPFVFVCYAHADKEVVYAELEWLHTQGVNVWYDEGISAGDNWRAAIGDALIRASRVLFYVSQSSLDSDHCNREINLALDESKEILPIYLETVELTSDLKVGLARVQALRRDAADFRAKLADTLQGRPAGSMLRLASAPGKTQNKRTLLASVAFLAVAAVVLGWYGSNELLKNTVNMQDRAEGPGLDFYESMAVLPFTVLSNEADVSFFARGLTDNLLGELAKTPWLKVGSRTLTAQLVDEGLTLEALAEQMNVAFVLEGSVQELADDLLVSAQLIRASDNFQVWSRSDHLDMSDGYQAQKGAAKRLAHTLASSLWADVRREQSQLFKEFQGIHPRALALYLDGEKQELLADLGEDGDRTYACVLYKRASEIDPDFVSALTEYAWCLVDRVDPNLSLEDAIADAKATIEHVVEIDPQWLSIKLVRMRLLTLLLLDYESAQAAHARSVERFPEARGHLELLGEIAAREGRVSDAVMYYDRAKALNYAADEPHLLVNARFRLAVGDYEGSKEFSDEMLNVLPNGRFRSHALMLNACAMIGLGRMEEARTLVQKGWAMRGSENPAHFAYAFAKIGEVERAQAILADAEVALGDAGYFARGYAALGENDKAIEYMRLGIDTQDPSVLDVIRIDVALDGLRREPAFKEALAVLESKETHTSAFLQEGIASMRR